MACVTRNVDQNKVIPKRLNQEEGQPETWKPYSISDQSQQLLPHFRPLKLVHGSKILPQLTRNDYHWHNHLSRATMCIRKKNGS